MDEEYLSTIETSTSLTDTELVDVKNNEEQKEWMKRIFLNYKPDASTGEIENLWSRVSEMVGFFSEPVSTGGGGANSPDTRRVVCYPDLPAAAAPPNHEVAYRTGGGAIKVEDPYRTTIQPRSTTIAPIIAGAKQEPREDPYQCNVCNKTFAVPARLTRHYRTHTGERPFQCDFCDKKFGVKENLSVHRRIHTKERPYKCEVCSRAFEHSGKLHRHMRIHTGERPHACSVCNKTFIQSGQLVIHMRTHTGEKPYVCPVCDKGFTCSKQLKVHSRTHTGEKPYNCDICGKSFGYNHVLKLHQVAHYGQKVYKCTICQDTFTSKKTMEAHIKTHSENSPQSPVEQSLSSLSSLSSSSSSASLPPLSPTMGTPTSVLQHNNINNNPELLVNNNSDSSCTSDKENKDLIINVTTSPSPMEQDSPIYYQPSSQRQSVCNSQTPVPSSQIESPTTIQIPPTNYHHHTTNIYHPSKTSEYVYINSALLAAAAAAREERTQSPPQAQTSPYDGYPTLPTTDMRNFVTVYVPSQKVQDVTPPRLDNGNGIRKCIEAVLATAAISSTEDDPLLITPPSSHSTSPSPSVSPEPAAEYNTRQTLILPPRKRSKAILKSMQQDSKSLIATATSAATTVGPVRYCSVIQFGGSSL